MTTVTSVGKSESNAEVNKVKDQGISIYFIFNNAYPVNLTVGRTWIDPILLLMPQTSCL